MSASPPLHAQPAAPYVESELATKLELLPVLEALHHRLRACNVAAFCPVLTEHGWDLEFSVMVGPQSAARRLAHQAFVRNSPIDVPSFCAYDPFAVQVCQQNRALDNDNLAAIDAKAPTRHQQIYQAISASETEQIRVLVCQGPRLLAWVGAMREEPFRRKDLAALQSLAEPLREQLSVARQLASVRLHQPMMESVLEALEQPALILSAAFLIEFANSRARELLDQPEGRAMFATLRGQLAANLPHPGFNVVPLPGCPGYSLALYARRDERLASAIASARRSWSLTARTTTFLEHVARGLSNKEIARLLCCAEVTVEKQLTQLFRSSGARSRTELMAKLHAL